MEAYLGSFTPAARCVWALAALTTFGATEAKAQIAVPSGIYIRGEAGVALHEDVDFNDLHTTAPDCFLCGGPVVAPAGTSGIFGGAVGFRFNENLRTDLSVDYVTSANINGENAGSPPTTVSSKVNSLVVLANVYVDFPEFPSGILGPLIPYIDGGLGLAQNSLGAISGTTGAAGAYTLNGQDRTAFAYALGLGVSYPVAPRFTVDFGYRFLDVGELRSGTSLTQKGTVVQVTGARSNGVMAQTLMAGLRYEL